MSWEGKESCCVPTEKACFASYVLGLGWPPVAPASSRLHLAINHSSGDGTTLGSRMRRPLDSQK